jgi:hypothetical protein
MAQNALETYTVTLPDGRVIRRSVAAGASDAEVRREFADALAQAGWRDPSAHAVQRPALPQAPANDVTMGAEVTSYEPTWSEWLGSGFGAAVSPFMGEYASREAGHDMASFLGDLTPVGNLDDIWAGSTQERQLAMLPIPGPARRAVRGGIRAFHGSPHDFDRFSLDRIGTGEGHQAYGRGLYFAENEDVARTYRDQLSAGERSISFNGRTITSADGLETLEPQELAAVITAQHGGSVADAISNTSGILPYMPSGYAKDVRSQALDELITSPQRYEGIDWSAGGRMYEVNINADPDSLLDWDRPLWEQSETVQRAVLPGADIADLTGSLAEIEARKEALALDRLPSNRMRDEAAWHDLARQSERLQRELSIAQNGRTAYGWLGGERLAPDSPYAGLGAARAPSVLRDRGIPGIRYLDQGSRAAGEGSRNYVIFDDSLIDIMRKYAVPGLFGSSVTLNALTGRPPEQEGY